MDITCLTLYLNLNGLNKYEYWVDAEAEDVGKYLHTTLENTKHLKQGVYYLLPILLRKAVGGAWYVSLTYYYSSIPGFGGSLEHECTSRNSLFV